MPYEYGPYKKTSIKLNYNCPESEKSGSGPGSCSGASGIKEESSPIAGSKKANTSTKEYSWGKLTVASVGNSYKAIMHPKHREELANLDPNEKTVFKDEQGKKWQAERRGDIIQLRSEQYKTHFPYNDISDARTKNKKL